MTVSQAEITYVGGPTALISFHGVRFLTDPTFDPGGDGYVAGPVTLHKVGDPAVGLAALGIIDYILLSHDQHFDNLDHAGRKMLSQAKHVLTTDEGALYFSGDTVWYEGVAEVARWIRVTTAVLNMGAARVQAAGPAPLTMTADDGIQVAKAMPDAVIVPLHFEGWKHFSESKQVIQETFRAAGMDSRLRWLDPASSQLR